MKLHLNCGKGGVGKTTTAASLAIFFAERGGKTGIIDYDGGHSVAGVLGLQSVKKSNVPCRVGKNLALCVIDVSPFVGIIESKRKDVRMPEYLNQFPGHLGLVPFADMVSSFFGVPTDVEGAQKFGQLVEAVLWFEEHGYSHVVIDVEPTAGFERLMSNVENTVRSLRNLSGQGILTLAGLRATWPDIAGYLKGNYIAHAKKYCAEIEQVATALRSASYLLVCTPEQGPVRQVLEVRGMIDRFGGKSAGVVINNVRGEPHEERCIRFLKDCGLRRVEIARQPLLHDTEHSDRRELLLPIGQKIASELLGEK